MRIQGIGEEMRSGLEVGKNVLVVVDVVVVFVPLAQRDPANDAEIE